MKKLILLLFIILFGGIVIFGATKLTGQKTNQEYLRIHIRANSNQDIYQNVKYLVKDAIVKAIIPILCDCKTKEEAQKAVEVNLSYISSIASKVLKQNKFSYSAKAKLTQEDFPTRSYGNLTLDAGFYDALIIELGEAEGNNWWCVVYPPFCFLEANPTGEGVVYKSKILEILKSIF